MKPLFPVEATAAELETLARIRQEEALRLPSGANRIAALNEAIAIHAQADLKRLLESRDLQPPK